MLVAEVFVDDGQGDLVQHDVVRGDLAGDHHLADPVGGVDGDLGAVAVGGVHGDGDAGDAGVDHLLHHDSHGEAFVGDVVPEPVDDGAGGEERCPALPDVFGDGFDAVEPEVGVLLAGEGGVREVLCGGAGADGHRDRCLEAGHQGLVGGNGQLAEDLGYRTGADVLADGGGDLVHLAHVLGVQIGEELVDMPGDACFLHKGVELVCGDHKAGRDRHAGGGHGDQGGALAAEVFEFWFDAAVEELDVFVALHISQAFQLTETVSGTRKERFSRKAVASGFSSASPGASRATSSSAILAWSLASILPRQ
ncbi:hypothetical protein BJQ90_02494 [Arthrobacter sp. SO3]|nr:hypothetical protein [Arthrobacter sp. SO3]